MLVIFSLGVCTVDGGDCRGNGGLNFADTVVVDKSGSGNFTSVQSAIDSIPLNNRRWIKVQINPGVFVEKVTIPRGKPCIVLEGRDRSVTMITYNRHDQTDKSATFTSVPDNIVAKGITFKNSYNHPWLQKRALSNRQIPGVSQAVAARVLGDKSAFFECGFLGLQDTLWDALGRHYFFRCHIEGAEDFIFGTGQSFYEECSINVTACAFSSQLPYGYITAQGRQSSDDPSGFVFKGGEIFGTVRPYLGRAWGPYSRVIFQGTTMNSDVIPQGWDAWRFPGKEENFVYAEVDCKGPGSHTSNRVPWEKKLNPDQLKQFSLWSFVDQDGWLDRLPRK
ncbi:hypothetical protein V6N13_141166 [Hibiscus sabdariffa]|uniref:pectinesterase n=1 Tax=Hibiscus sabdariffa TaxID=183260 RepID=A0ABR2Q0Q8_9ROSI